MATVIPYDVSDVEDSLYGDGTEEPKPSVYPAKIIKAEKREETSKGAPANDIHVLCTLGGDYVLKSTYVGLGPESDWKLKEFIKALGLKDKGKLDLEKIAGKMIRVKINPDTWEGEYRGKIGRIMRASDDDVLPEPGKNGSKPTAAADDTDDGDGDASEQPTGYPPTDEFPEGYEPVREDPDREDVGSYDDWSDEDVEAEFSDRGLTAPGGRGKKRDKLIKVLREDDADPVTADSGGGGAEPETAAETTDDYDEWDAEQLETEIGERSLEVKKPRGSNAEQRYMTAMVEALRADDEANPFDAS